MKRIICALLLSLSVLVALASNEPTRYKAFQGFNIPKNAKIVAKGATADCVYLVTFINNGGNGSNQLSIWISSITYYSQWYKLTLSIDTYYQSSWGWPPHTTWQWGYINWTAELGPNHYTEITT